MGEASKRAHKVLDNSPNYKKTYMVRGRLVVRCRDKGIYNNTFGIYDQTDEATYNFSSNDHAEVRAFFELGKRTKKFADLEANSTLIYASTFSPCRECVEANIPGIMTQILAVQPTAVVKFLFKKYWITANQPPEKIAAKHVYADHMAAREDYEALCKKYAIWKSKDYDGRDPDYAKKNARQLVIESFENQLLSGTSEIQMGDWVTDVSGS